MTTAVATAPKTIIRDNKVFATLADLAEQTGKKAAQVSGIVNSTLEIERIFENGLKYFNYHEVELYYSLKPLHALLMDENLPDMPNFRDFYLEAKKHYQEDDLNTSRVIDEMQDKYFEKVSAFAATQVTVEQPKLTASDFDSEPDTSLEKALPFLDNAPLEKKEVFSSPNVALDALRAEATSGTLTYERLSSVAKSISKQFSKINFVRFLATLHNPSCNIDPAMLQNLKSEFAKYLGMLSVESEKQPTTEAIPGLNWHDQKPHVSAMPQTKETLSFLTDEDLARMSPKMQRVIKSAVDQFFKRLVGSQGRAKTLALASIFFSRSPVLLTLSSLNALLHKGLAPMSDPTSAYAKLHRISTNGVGTYTLSAETHQHEDLFKAHEFLLAATLIDIYGGGNLGRSSAEKERLADRNEDFGAILKEWNSFLTQSKVIPEQIMGTLEYRKRGIDQRSKDLLSFMTTIVKGNSTLLGSLLIDRSSNIISTMNNEEHESVAKALASVDAPMEHTQTFVEKTSPTEAKVSSTSTESPPSENKAVIKYSLTTPDSYRGVVDGLPYFAHEGTKVTFLPLVLEKLAHKNYISVDVALGHFREMLFSSFEILNEHYFGKVKVSEAVRKGEDFEFSTASVDLISDYLVLYFERYLSIVYSK